MEVNNDVVKEDVYNTDKKGLYKKIGNAEQNTRC